MRSFVAGLACIVVGGCAYTPPGERMTGEAFIALVRGNTMDGRFDNGTIARTFVTPELEQRGLARPSNGAETRYAGRIRAAEHGFCSQSPQLRGGEERCFEVWRDGATLRSVWNGTPWTTMRIEPGNPYGL